METVRQADVDVEDQVIFEVIDPIDVAGFRIVDAGILALGIS